MIGIDANVVRILTRDDPDQAELARRTLDEAEEVGRLDPIVLAEAGWVLRSRYRHGRGRIAAGPLSLLRHPRVTMDARAAVEAALTAYEAGGAGLSDHLIGALNAAAGCRITLTFDKSAAKGPHYGLIA